MERQVGENKDEGRKEDGGGGGGGKGGRGGGGGEEAADRPTKRAVRAQWRRTEIAAAPVIADWSMPIIPLADEKRKKSEGSLTDH